MKKSAPWFKQKTYGYGWIPATIHGWIVLGVYLVSVVSLSVWKAPQLEAETTTWIFLHYVLPVSVLTAALIVLSYLKGEKPEWRWGELRGQKALVPNFILINIIILLLIFIFAVVLLKDLN